MPFSLDQIGNYKPDPDFLKSPAVQALTAQSYFQNSRDIIAIVACGGTLSSTYLPEDECIAPTSSNVALNTIRNFQKLWGIAPQALTGVSLINKDSREFTAEDVTFVLNFLNAIENSRILVTAGTYVGPLFAQAAHLFVTGNKTIGFTGSSLPAAIVNNDVDANVFGTLSAINSCHRFRSNQGTQVLFQYHGQIMAGDELQSINLHPNADNPVAVAGAIEKSLVRILEI
jgi:L-asparaginase/Glu-tRNA(Gln) amidotransferase subunit D